LILSNIPKLFFEALDKDKDKHLFVGFSPHGKSYVQWPEPDLDRTHVAICGRRQDCVFEHSDEKHFCCISDLLTNTLKDKLKKTRNERGKASAGCLVFR